MKICSWIAAIFLPLVSFADEPNQKKYSGKDEVFNDYIKGIIYAFLDKPDPSISLMHPKNQPEELTLIFNEIPGKPPYKLETRRLKQFDPNRYHTAHDQQFVLNNTRIGDGGFEVPFGVHLPSKAYLPGERVFWRIRSQAGEVLKEAVCCPRPLLLKNADGKVLMEAMLMSANRPTTVYCLWFLPREKAFDLIFHCGKEQKIEISAGGLESTTFEPKIPGKTGGISTIEIVSDGQSCRMDLPWGSELEKY